MRKTSSHTSLRAIKEESKRASKLVSIAPSTKEKTVEEVIQSLFPIYFDLQEQERLKLEQMEEQNKEENLRIGKLIGKKKRLARKKPPRQIPLFRYIPSRLIMQRMIMRATQLPHDFVDFEKDY